MIVVYHKNHVSNIEDKVDKSIAVMVSTQMRTLFNDKDKEELPIRVLSICMVTKKQKVHLTHTHTNNEWTHNLQSINHKDTANYGKPQNCQRTRGIHYQL